MSDHDPVFDTFPTGERIYGWIADLAGLGHRRTGTAQGRASAEYIAGVLTGLGVEGVTIETAPTACPVVHAHGLTVGNRTAETFWANGTGRTDTLGRFETSPQPETEVIYVGAGWESDFEGMDVEGKIVICDIEFHPISDEDILNRHPRATTYDPDNTLGQQDGTKFDIYSPNNWPNNYFFAQQRGAAGFVGVLRDYMDANYYNEDYTENGAALGIDRMEIPALWVSRADGQAIVDEIRDGRSRGNLTLDVEYEMKDALNVHGILPGESPDIILVHSHHDAVFAGAVQDASGVSEVLALAAHFAQVPRAARQKTMMFALTDTHFTDYIGHGAFIESRQKDGSNILLDLCIEHIGNEVVLDANGDAKETGLVEPRLVYVSDETGLLPAVQAAFERNGLGRTYFAPVAGKEHHDGPYEFQPDEIISDAYPFAEAGIPVVSMVCGQMYLFHPSDTVDRIPLAELRPVGLAFAEIAAEAMRRL